MICRGLTVTSMPACSKTSTEDASWTIATVKRAPCTFASVAAKWFFMSSRIAKIATWASAIRSRSRKSGSKPGRVVDARSGQLRGHDARALARGLDQPDADALLEQQARDGRARAAGAEDDHVPHLARAGRDQLAPLLGRLRRADHDDPVAGADRLVAARDHDVVAADDRRDARVGRDPRLAQRRAEDARIGLLGDVELDDLHLAVGEDVGLPRRGHADRP